MTLSQIIKLRTNDGLAIVDFLLEVMQDRYDDFRICHRLQAARLLNTYGNEDSPNFIADNPQEPRSDRHNPRPSRPSKFDTELARLIREDTDDGRSIARFLVYVMEGELESFRPHHRMAAARELLDRGFGKSARTGPTETPGPSTDDNNKITVIPESQESQFRHSTDILDTLNHLQPERFEHTVLDLLQGLGYGRSHHLERSGDGGIDGIIDRDPLGTERFYFQAKRCTGPVDEPEIRHFSGSLDPHGVTRGLLITTSDFTDTARRTAGIISAGNKLIRLVDGTELAHLILTHNIRVTSDTPNHPRKPDKNHHTHHT